MYSSIESALFLISERFAFILYDLATIEVFSQKEMLHFWKVLARHQRLVFEFSSHELMRIYLRPG